MSEGYLGSMKAAKYLIELIMTDNQLVHYASYQYRSKAGESLNSRRWYDAHLGLYQACRNEMGGINCICIPKGQDFPLPCRFQRVSIRCKSPTHSPYTLWKAWYLTRCQNFHANDNWKYFYSKMGNAICHGTAFMFHHGHSRSVHIPLGLTNKLAKFQQAMDVLNVRNKR